tara:strand:+ start:372 stop:572 length:201 start_codon:yes stop_codon:yes gene_type:complete
VDVVELLVNLEVLAVELEAFNLVVLHLEQGEVQLHVKVMQEEQQVILQEQLVVVELVQLVQQVVHL